MTTFEPPPENASFPLPEQELRDLLDAIPQITWVSGPRAELLFCNRRFLEFSGVTYDEIITTGWQVVMHPEDVDACLAAGQVSVAQGAPWKCEYRLRRNDGRYRWHLGHAAPQRDDDGVLRRWVGTATDIDDLKRAQAELSRGEERYRQLLETSLQGVLFIDTQENMTYINPAIARLLGYERDELQDRPLLDIFFEADHAAARARRELRRRGVSEQYEVRLRRRDGSPCWVLAAISVVHSETGEYAGTFAMATDVTERRQAEEALAAAYRRESLINEIGNAIRGSALDGDAIRRTVVAALGRALQADRCYYVTYEQGLDRNRLGPDWYREDLSSIAGDYRTSDFAINREVGYLGGHTQVVDDLHEHSRGEDQRALLDALGLRALVRAPLQPGETMTTLVVAMADAPRHWTDDEVRLVEIVAAQTHSALETARLLAEETARAEREAAVRRITEVVLSSSDPDEIRERAVAALGIPLRADRCYFVAFDLSRNAMVIGKEWCADGLTAISGEYRAPSFPVPLQELFGRNEPLVVRDTRLGPENAPWSEVTSAAIAGLGISSAITVPFLDSSGRLVAALGAAMARETREWTEDEVDLVETVAAQTRAAVEAVLLAQRERNIARQLQAALQPPLPGDTPGLVVREYHQAALDEAEVGGDFYDVFPIRSGAGDSLLTALIVGDLSGKGLIAAAQVATLRNMLRYALYQRPSAPAAAVADLNRVLTDNNLLSGFATLFVGLYAPGTHTLTYVCCGQEPGLIWRALSGQVEELVATGPVIGAFGGSAFAERKVTLRPGDALALFTDGLTEAGPHRRALLGVEGVTALLSANAAATVSAAEETTAAQPTERAADLANRLVTGLMAGVESHTGGPIRDDVCLLVGVTFG